MSAKSFCPIHIHVSDPNARIETTVTVLMDHDEALKMCINETRAVRLGDAVSGPVTLRQAGRILHSLGVGR